MRNKLRKIFKRIGKPGFFILLFILFGVWGFCHNGWLGVLGVAFGYSLAWFFCERWERIKNFPWKKFFRRHLKAIIQLIIFVPIASACTYYYGWKGFLTACAGWCVGELISRRIFKFK